VPRVREPEEFEDLRVFDEVLCIFVDLPVPGKLQDAFFIFAERQPLKETALPLPFEFTDRPVFFDTLCFVERAREVVGYYQQLGLMRPA